ASRLVGLRSSSHVYENISAGLVADSTRLPCDNKRQCSGWDRPDRSRWQWDDLSGRRFVPGAVSDNDTVASHRDLQPLKYREYNRRSFDRSRGTCVYGPSRYSGDGGRSAL